MQSNHSARPSILAGSALLILAIFAACNTADRSGAAETRRDPTTVIPSRSERAEYFHGDGVTPQSEYEAPEPARKQNVQDGQAVPPTGSDEGALPFNTETYDRIYENDFLGVHQNPLSTFSIDVDTASYSITRRFLNQGSTPPPDAVRIEELINYFNYDYAGPQGDADPFAVHTEVSAAPWNPEHRLLHVGIQAKRFEQKDLPPRNLVFLLDVSGSMDASNKLPLLKRSLRLLTEQMSEKDRVAIVVYAGASGVVLEPTRGDQQEKIMDAFEKLSAGGSTNGGEGIELAYKLARANFHHEGINRVILATDGDFNVGTTNQGDLIRLIEKERESGVFLTVLGFGMGNYKDSTMEKLADKGNGNYAYIDTVAEARKTLVNEAGGTLIPVAKDVKLQLEFNPRTVAAYRLIGYENRLLRAEDFNDDKKDAGEIGAGHSVTALYEIVPAGKEVPTGTVDPLKYQTTGDATDAANSNELLTVKIRYKQPQGSTSKLLSFAVSDGEKKLEETSDNYRFSAAVAAYGMLLRDSKHRGGADYDLVRKLAQGSLGEDPHGYRAEFLRLAAMAKDMR